MPYWSASPRYVKGQRALRHGFPVPRFIALPLYFTHTCLVRSVRWLVRFLYSEPLFRARCDTAGDGFSMRTLPDISGHTHLELGRNVRLKGHMAAGSGRIFDFPKLVLADGVQIGHDVAIAVNKEIVLEEGVRIGGGSRLMDTDAHPRDAAMRAANIPPPPEEVKPVRIRRHAAIGPRSFVLKGVTIGEGATIGPASVVVSDIPPFTVAVGNPARIIARPKPASQPAAGQYENS